MRASPFTGVYADTAVNRNALQYGILTAAAADSDTAILFFSEKLFFGKQFIGEQPVRRVPCFDGHESNLFTESLRGNLQCRH